MGFSMDFILSPVVSSTDRFYTRECLPEPLRCRRTSWPSDARTWRRVWRSWGARDRRCGRQSRRPVGRGTPRWRRRRGRWSKGPGMPRRVVGWEGTWGRMQDKPQEMTSLVCCNEINTVADCHTGLHLPTRTTSPVPCSPQRRLPCVTRRRPGKRSGPARGASGETERRRC